jgi:hypothetical protein
MGKSPLFILSLFLIFISCANPCKNIDCSGNGSCNQGICACRSGYEGRDCESEIRKKFIGTFDMAEECSSGPTIYTVIIEPDPNNAEKIILNNIYNTEFEVKATVDKDLFVIEQTEFSSIGQISGTGKITNGDLRINYSIVTGPHKDDCVAQGRRK